MPKIARLVAVVAFLSTTASAQSVDRSPRGTVLRVQTQMQVTLPARNVQDLAEQAAQQESARRTLYEMASRECRNLKEVFGGECRLVSVNANTSLQTRHQHGSPVDTIVASANATFEVIPVPGTPL